MQIIDDKEEIINKKKEAIRVFNNTLEFYLNDNESKNYKKVQLLSKWLIDFSNYIRFEDRFQASKNIAYKRGDIVKVNFGFNIGSELGGVHYAIVIDKNNKHSADTLTVIPLSSYKANKQLYERDLYIGSEFYTLVAARTAKILKEANVKVKEFSETINILEKHKEDDPEVSELLKKYSVQRNDLIKKVEFGIKCHKELAMMKNGSVVKIEQIRTISKMRILDPKKTHDVLYGIHLSDSTMDKINERIKELFLH